MNNTVSLDSMHKCLKTYINNNIYYSSPAKPSPKKIIP